MSRPSHRQMLFSFKEAARWFAALAVALSCSRPAAIDADQPPLHAPEPPAKRGTSPRPLAASSPRTPKSPSGNEGAPLGARELESITYLERLTVANRDPATLPTIIAIHGLGDEPSSFLRVFDGFQVPARILAPQGLDPYEGGYSWFPIRARDGDVVGLSTGLREAALRLAAFVRAATPQPRGPNTPPVLVTGFSQGGMLSFALAVLEPDLVTAAVPVGGWLPPPLWPTAIPTGRCHIVAFHGAADRVVPFAPTEQSIRHLRTLGCAAELQAYPDVGHEITPALRHDWHALLARLIAP